MTLLESPPVYVLVGGGSRRFGRDKAFVEIDGLPWATHVGQRLAGDDGAVAYVGKLSDELEGSPCVPDAAGFVGPLAGVLAALEHRAQRHGPGLVVLASCDLVRPERAWLAPLLAANKDDASLDVAAYRAADRWQPFPSVAHTRWIERLRGDLEAGRRSFQEVLRAPRVTAVVWPGDADGPPQANTPEALQSLLGDE